jgi:hypothetical protein
VVRQGRTPELRRDVRCRAPPTAACSYRRCSYRRFTYHPTARRARILSILVLSGVVDLLEILGTPSHIRGSSAVKVTIRKSADGVKSQEAPP